jgi:valyl-tRNA synthetase
MNDDATMNEYAGKYEGMDRYECRKAWVADLDAEGFLVKTEDMRFLWADATDVTAL